MTHAPINQLARRCPALGLRVLVNDSCLTAELATALRQGSIRCAALDVSGVVSVFAEERFRTDHALFRLWRVELIDTP